MSLAIHVPFRERSDSLSDVAVAAHVLPADEARVVRKLVLSEILGGQATTAGQLLDKIENATPAERRKMLDDARVKAGLPSASEVEFREQHKRRQLAASVKGANDPRPLRVALTDAGTLVDLNERDDEIARDRAKEESHRHAREDREAERAEWARLEADEQRRQAEAQARDIAQSMRLPGSEAA